MIGWICLPNILFGCNHMVLDNACHVLAVIKDLRSFYLTHMTPSRFTLLHLLYICRKNEELAVEVFKIVLEQSCGIKRTAVIKVGWRGCLLVLC